MLRKREVDSAFEEAEEEYGYLSGAWTLKDGVFVTGLGFSQELKVEVEGRNYALVHGESKLDEETLELHREEDYLIAITENRIISITESLKDLLVFKNPITNVTSGGSHIITVEQD